MGYKWAYKLVSYRIIPPYKWSYFTLLTTGFWMFLGPLCRCFSGFLNYQHYGPWVLAEERRFAVLLETLGLVREILLISLGFVYGGFLLILPWYITMKTTSWGIYSICHVFSKHRTCKSKDFRCCIQVGEIEKKHSSDKIDHFV